jgi:cobalt-zinc-cadmium resistance protein CzcA
MLGNFRSALVVSINLPLSVLFTFLLMNIFGIPANLMSLGGIAIAIGILIDSSIVVVENIHSQLSLKDKRLGRLHLIYRAVEEVAVPVVSGVAIIITVFIPLFSLTGLEAKMFTPLAVTISFAMACALFLSLTVVPVLASFLMKSSTSGEGRLFQKLVSIYRPVVFWAIDKRKIAVGAALILLAGSLALFPLIGKEFMPSMDEGTTVVIIEKDSAITLEKSLADDERYQKAMMEIPEVTGVVARTGADELRLDPMDLYQTDNFLLTKPRSEWTIGRREFEEKVRDKLSQFEGLDIAFTQPIDMRVSEMITGVRAAMAIKLFGDDIDTLELKSKEIEELVKSIPGSVDVIRTEITGQKYLQIDTDSKKMAKYGLNSEQVNQVIESAVAGRVISEVLMEEKRIGVLVRYPEVNRSDAKSISEILISTPSGNKISIQDVATISEVDGPFQITREFTKRQVVVQSNVEDRDVVSFVDEVKDGINKKIDLPKGYYVTFGGQFENQQRAAKRLTMVIPTSIALIFLILFLTFRSSRQSLLIILNIPFALIGGIIALYCSGMYMSVPASVGFIALFGVAVMNGVVMVTYFNQLRESGKSILESVKYGAERRLRPVLMTASITILGLLPLLLASGPGSELQKPLSVVVIGGTITSTLLTLILLPTLYAWVEEKSEQKSRKERV